MVMCEQVWHLLSDGFVIPKRSCKILSTLSVDTLVVSDILISQLLPLCGLAKRFYGFFQIL